MTSVGCSGQPTQHQDWYSENHMIYVCVRLHGLSSTHIVVCYGAAWTLIRTIVCHVTGRCPEHLQDVTNIPDIVDNIGPSEAPLTVGPVVTPAQPAAVPPAQAAKLPMPAAFYWLAGATCSAIVWQNAPLTRVVFMVHS